MWSFNLELNIFIFSADRIRPFITYFSADFNKKFFLNLLHLFLYEKRVFYLMSFTFSRVINHNLQKAELFLMGLKVQKIVFRKNIFQF